MNFNPLKLTTIAICGLGASSLCLAQDDKSVYMIQFNDAPLLEYKGDNAKFQATSPAITKERKPNLQSRASQTYLSYLEQVQSEQLSQISQQIGREINYKFQYKLAQNGAALELSAGEAAQLANMPGIKAIAKDVIYEINTDAGPSFIGADSLWSGSSMPNNMPNKGEGVVIAVLDTGINMDHASYSDTPEDGYDFASANPLGAGNFLGECAGVNPTVTCNNKLIGAYDFAGDGPEDTNGHGSHTAGTAAGNHITAPQGGFVTTSNVTLDAPSISGVAPHAHIIAYDVCTSGCAGAAISGAIDQAITDGVDVLSFSISGGTSPWSSFDNDRLFLNALNAGIVVSASAGNTRDNNPNPETDVNHKGPWLLSVANSTHNRANSNTVNITGPGQIPAQLVNMYGLLGVRDNFVQDVDADIIYAGDVDVNNFEGCTAWTGTPFTGSIALISRGSCNFSAKIDNAAAAGAEAVIIYNNQSPVPIVMGGIETTTIPAVMVGLTDGNNMVDWIANAVTQATASILGTSEYRLIDAVGDTLAASSLRGPNLTFDVTKPDINGPGSNILAAYQDAGAAAPQLEFLSGTSMSAPHISGAAALMVAAHPDWSPSEIKSAMMMTASYATNKKDNGTDPADADDIGSGTVDLTQAALAGLVMDETFANYLAADPAALGGDPKTLNIPSARNQNCNPDCSWTRTVKTTMAEGTTWDISTETDGNFTLSVSANEFSFDPEDLIFADSFDDTPPPPSTRDVEFTFTFTASAVADIEAGMAFGKVILTERDGKAPDAHITVTVNLNEPTGFTVP
ncbi:S8 family serine peptidase [Marinicella rhabdoformis]|uniref:S8 family serine peptidase n=1 Tax=Marinicella rhabdoformis TaxID=2580566 RepID=UPI0012AEDB84|nr:S8 family serine peptidase [Marinicella rhabdoformis]